MGIAIAAIYLPLYAVFSGIAMVVGSIPLRSARGHPIPSAAKLSAYLCGAFATLFLTTFYAWWYSTNATDAWAPVVGSILISLVGPPLVGLAMLIAWWTKGGSRPSSFNYAVAGAWQSTLAMPVVGILFLVFYDDVVVKPAFDKLCASAKLIVLEVVPPARSAVFIPEVFFASNRTGDGQYLARGLLLPANTTLQFIETTVSERGGKERLVRIAYSARQEAAPSDPSEPQKTFVETPIEASSAEYQVRSRTPDVPNSLANRIGARRIEVTRSSDGKLIAYAQYYWHTSNGWACPVGTDKNSYIKNFIAKSLSVPSLK